MLSNEVKLEVSFKRLVGAQCYKDLREGVGFGVGFIGAILRRRAKQGEGKKKKKEKFKKRNGAHKNI